MAKLKYTFDDYINNPSGKGSAVHGSINISQYEKELLSLEGKNSKTTYTVYKQSTGNKVTYYIHFLIPSTTKDFFHDVVVEFNPNADDKPSTKSIKAYNVRFFSNDSNFIYTYAYTFKSHGVLITELETLLPFRSIIQKPTMRNPDNAMGYNKSIIFAYIVMNRDNLFIKENLNRISKTGSLNNIKSNIKSFDKKEKERNKIIKDAKASGNKEKQSESKNKVIKSKNLLGDNPIPIPPKVTKIVNKVKKTSTISNVKKSKKR